MRIECPSCAAAYEVPTERLAAGRAVKCARCNNTWSPVPGAPVPDPPPIEAETAVPAEDVSVPEAPPDVQTHDDPPVPAPLSPRRAPLILAWVLSLAVLGALGWAAIDRRAAVMHAWPPSIRAYAALGLLK